jgi:hypothetical protein
VLALAALSACDGPSPTEPPFPLAAVPMDMPPHYAIWWQLTEACSGLSADLSQIHWYEIPGVTTFTVRGEAYNGYWWREGNRIVIAGGSVDDGSLVRHEMLHDLIGRDGHPRSYFLDRCGGVVACVEECLSDAGGPVPFDPTAPVIDASQLEVTTTIVPREVWMDSADPWLSVMVSVTNRSATAVRVRLADPPAGVRFANGANGYQTFGFRIEAIGGDGSSGGSGAEFRSRGTDFFAAGQTKRHVFDLALDDPSFGAWSAGRYQVVGSYANNAVAPVELTVSP